MAGLSVSLIFTTSAQAVVTREWRCEAINQHGLEIPEQGDGQTSVRSRSVPLSVKIIDNGAELDVSFDDSSYTTAFGHRFTRRDAVISTLRDVVRAASTSTDGSSRTFALEKDGSMWRFALSGTGFLSPRQQRQARAARPERVATTTHIVTGECRDKSSPVPASDRAGMAALIATSTASGAKGAPTSSSVEPKESAPVSMGNADAATLNFDLVLTRSRVSAALSLLSRDKPEAGDDMLKAEPLFSPSLTWRSTAPWIAQRFVLAAKPKPAPAVSPKLPVPSLQKPQAPTGGPTLIRP